MQKNCGLPFQTLLDWQEKRLTAEESAAVEQHVADGCAACRENLGWLADVLPALSEAVTPAPAPSAAALAYAKGLARLLRPVATETPTSPIATVRQHLARLVQGTGRQTLALAGARGGTVPARRHVFESDFHTITVWDEPEEAGETRYIIGQIYPRGGGEAAALPFRAVTLLPTGGEAERDAQREGSEFHFEGVTPGVYLLRCLLEADEIVVPQVEVGRE